MNRCQRHPGCIAGTECGKFLSMSQIISPTASHNACADLLTMRHWTTDGVGASKRLDYWVGAICEAFLEMDCDSKDGLAFSGQLTSVGVGPLMFNQVLASPQDVYRTAVAVAKGQQHPFYLITQVRSAWRVRQGEHFSQLRPGDAVLVDSAQRYELHFPHSVDCLSIQLPRAWVGQWLAQVESAAPRVIHKDQGWGQTLSALSLQFAQNPALALNYPQSLLCDHVGAMLSAALEPMQAARHDSGLWPLILARLSDQLATPSLTALDVARAVGISVRSLHRCCAAQQTSFAAALRQGRTERATSLLSQRQFTELTIAEVGQRCGYADASHFVRDFQSSLGQTPSRWRKQILSG